jgi:hypothetical protein
MAGATLELTVDDRELRTALRTALRTLQDRLGDLTPVFWDLGHCLQVKPFDRLSRGNWRK